MPYHISNTDSQKIVFQRDSVTAVSVIFTILGFVFVSGGILLNFIQTEWEFPFSLFKLLLPLFGLVAIIAGINLPKQTRETSPEQIVFDHQKGAALVFMSATDSHAGVIRYDEIASFETHIETQNSGKSSSRYYHVYLKKKDGGEWYLTRSGTSTQSDLVLNQLRQQVDLTKPCLANFTPRLSSKISKQEGSNKTVIHWNNKVSLWSPLFLVFFALIFLSIMAAIFMTDGMPHSIFPLIVGGFILSVFFLVFYIVIKKMLKDATTRYAVAVDQEHFEYYEFSKNNGQMKNSKKLPLSEVKRVCYSFSYGSTSTTFNSVLTVLTASDISQLESNRDKPLTALKNLFQGIQPITLSITALNPVECLQLEAWLQELILKRGNVQVA